jgi:hypothetical protein
MLLLGVDYAQQKAFSFILNHPILERSFRKENFEAQGAKTRWSSDQFRDSF